MEVRASYALVGAFVLTLVATLAGLVIWLARVEIDRSFDIYEVAFTGSVTGLQTGSAVRYQGVPVGRVSSIRINPDNIGEVLVTLELQPDTPVRTDTVATVEPQGLTGIATIQLSGGTHGSPMPDRHAGGPPPRITAGRSTLEQVFDTTPVVLNRIAAVLDRVGVLLDDENLTSINAIIDDLEDIADAVAESEPQVRALMRSLTDTSDKVGATAATVATIADDLRATLGKAGERVDALGTQGEAALAEIDTAARSFRSLGNRLDTLVRRSEAPIGDFSQSTLYEFRQLVAEMRQLVASTSRITKEFERDPAGYLLGAQQKGFQPQ
jgi:phospholipid/cholesterol/gamma-HCH transport system substrate-binding protein